MANQSCMTPVSVMSPPQPIAQAFNYFECMPPPSELESGDVFRLQTKSAIPSFDNRSVMIYSNWSLGINNGTGFPFEGSLIKEHNLLVMPEPLQTMKFNKEGVLTLNDSLYNPELVFHSWGTYLNITDAQTFICPSWDNVIVKSQFKPCPDAVAIALEVNPVYT